jgi:iron(III) transport system ATP-binding protein
MLGLSLHRVTKAFNSVLAVRDLTLDVKPGELLALLGPSGSGKTTVLRLIAGLERPDRGSIVIEGKVMVDAERGVWVPPERRNVGVVFQDYALFPHMTALQNVAFGLHRLRRRERKQRALAVLERVQIAHLAGRYPHELSGGEQQRVALARALAPEPRVLLLDEPFSNLDRSLRGQLRSEVRALLKQLSITTVFVTHDQQEALELGDRLAVLNAGCLEQVGLPEELLEHPKTRFVAEFLGETGALSECFTPQGLKVE